MQICGGVQQRFRYVLWLMLRDFSAFTVPERLRSFPYSSLYGSEAAVYWRMEIIQWNIYPH